MVASFVSWSSVIVRVKTPVLTCHSQTLRPSLSNVARPDLRSAARVESFDRAVTHAAAADYLAQRTRIFRRIGAAGVITLDVEPERLPIALVNRYLELKRGGRL